MPKISIIILNWNGWEDTIECLESLYRINYSNYEVIVVDNFSTNDSIQKIKDWTEWKIEVESKYFESTKCTHNIKIFEYTKADLEDNSYLERKKEFDKLESNKKLFLLKNDKNDGFAGGCNVWIKQILSENQSDYTLLLNNDTVVDKDFLNYLYNDIFNSEKCWMMSPINYNYFNNEIDFYWWWINRYKWWSYHIKYENDTKNFWFLTWCCLLIKNKVLEKVWGFDEKYFCYFEDADLSQKVLNSWFTLEISRNSKIYHKVSASSWKKSDFYIYHFSRNRILFNRKFNTWFSLCVFYMYQFLKTLFWIFYFNSSQRKAWFKWIKDGIRN